MLDVFTTPYHRRYVHRDCLLFQLHYKVTTAILLTFCLIVSLNQFLRSPLVCNDPNKPLELLNELCWMQLSMTKSPELKKKPVFDGVGLDPVVGLTEKDTPPAKPLHKNYQWVYLCLLFQALFFLLPGWLWSVWEGGKLRVLRMDLDVGFLTQGEKNEKKERLLEYLDQNRNNHNIWAYKYFFCELLAFVNVFGQILVMNSFLNGEFITLGVRFMQSDEEHPVFKIFPRMSKCIFNRLGPSGSIQIYDSDCALPLNDLNEKIYVFLWFWCLILFVATLVLVVFRILLIIIPNVRQLVFSVRHRRIGNNVTGLFAKQFNVGDFFLYYMLGENMDNMIFRDVMQEHARRFWTGGRGNGIEMQSS